MTTDALQISYEVYPPKNAQRTEKLKDVLAQLSEHNPNFISVTCGAGGSNNNNNTDLCNTIVNQYKTPCVAHLTCAGMDKDTVLERLRYFDSIGVRSILALRGDGFIEGGQNTFQYAIELFEFIQQHFDHMNVYVAGYPEGHNQNLSKSADFKHQVSKAKKGAKGVITQLFFDNDSFFSYSDKMRSSGYVGDIYSGIFVVNNAAQILKIATLSKVHIPKKLEQGLAKYQDKEQDLYKFGLDYACEQVQNLIENGQKHLHFYIMNHIETIEKIRRQIKLC